MTFTSDASFGLSIDAVTLFGLILVLGIIVDDAIVVLENIFRHLERGSPLLKATLEGSREVLAPVLASVTTTMAAFFPLLFMVGGVIGRYMAILPKVVIFALSASLFEVFFMLPSHVVELTPERKVSRIFRLRRDIFEPFRRIYYPFLRLILRHRYLSVLVIVAAPPAWPFFSTFRPTSSCSRKAIFTRASTSISTCRWAHSWKKRRRRSWTSATWSRNESGPSWRRPSPWPA